jgi:hypothetical protein
LENGQPREDFEGSAIIGGMFFKWGNPEPREKEFWEVSGFSYYLIRDGPSLKKYNTKALSLIDNGSKVITAFEKLAIGGLEGYITMMSKEER